MTSVPEELEQIVNPPDSVRMPDVVLRAREVPVEDVLRALTPPPASQTCAAAALLWSLSESGVQAMRFFSRGMD